MSSLQKLSTWEMAYALFRCMNLGLDEAAGLANKMDQTLDDKRKPHSVPTEDEDTALAIKFSEVMKEHEAEKAAEAKKDVGATMVKQVGEEGFSA